VLKDTVTFELVTLRDWLSVAYEKGTLRNVYAVQAQTATPIVAWHSAFPHRKEQCTQNRMNLFTAYSLRLCKARRQLCRAL